MYLENISLDARDPHLVGHFWEALLGCTTLLEGPDAFETRLSVTGGPVLDICVQRVPTSPRIRGACTSTSRAGCSRQRSSSRPWRSGPGTSTSGRVTCRGSSSPTPRATRSASWRSGLSTPRPARSPPCPWTARTSAKNRFHLDIRLERGDDADAVLARVLALGGSVLSHDWGEPPWQVVTDPSGNELCLLPARG